MNKDYFKKVIHACSAATQQERRERNHERSDTAKTMLLTMWTVAYDVV
jgi:hypothetical protein